MPSHAPVMAQVVQRLLCLTQPVRLCRTDKVTNGDVGPDEKKQEMERERLPEDASAGENQR